MIGSSVEQKVERPNPGSVEAREQGCKCPVLDNAHGLGAWGSRGEDAVFFIREGCPVHPFPEAVSD